MARPQCDAPPCFSEAGCHYVRFVSSIWMPVSTTTSNATQLWSSPICLVCLFITLRSPKPQCLLLHSWYRWKALKQLEVHWTELVSQCLDVRCRSYLILNSFFIECLIKWIQYPCLGRQGQKWLILYLCPHWLGIWWWLQNPFT